MTGKTTQYSSFFAAGQRISLTLQISGRNPFHEWAEILSLHADLLEVRLSRDTLPIGAQTTPGSTLEVRTGSRGNGYRCRGVIVSTGSATHLTLRLVGEVILDELREYFRIDVYLPLRLTLPEHQDVSQVKDEWLRRRAATISRKSGDFDFFHLGDSVSVQNPYLPPQAANISGGGVRLSTHEKLNDEDLVFLEIYLPIHPPAVLDVVGQVITATEQEEGDKTAYSTALRYLHIDERDRDRVIEFITTEQLAQLRSYRKGLPSLHHEETTRGDRAKKAALLLISLSLICLLLIWFCSWALVYSRQQPKSEIHRLFNEGLRRHLDKFR